MSSVFTGAVHMSYSTNVKKKCKGFQRCTVRSNGEILIKHLSKYADGSLYYGTD